MLQCLYFLRHHKLPIHICGDDVEVVVAWASLQRNEETIPEYSMVFTFSQPYWVGGIWTSLYQPPHPCLIVAMSCPPLSFTVSMSSMWTDTFCIKAVLKIKPRRSSNQWYCNISWRYYVKKKEREWLLSIDNFMSNTILTKLYPNDITWYASNNTC